MTGSAFAILIARGTLYLGWLRRITYFSTELREGKGRSGFHLRGGWRIYVGRSWLGVFHYFRASEGSKIASRPRRAQEPPKTPPRRPKTPPRRPQDAPKTP